MAIKRKITLAAPISLNEYQSLSAFKVKYIYIDEDNLTVHFDPEIGRVVDIYPEGAVDQSGFPLTTAKGRIVLGTTQTTKVSNFIQAIEDACKANLEL